MKNQSPSEMLDAPTIFSSDNTPPTSILRCRTPTTFGDPLAAFPDYVEDWEGRSDATYAWPPRFSALQKRLSGDLERMRFSSLFNVHERISWTNESSLVWRKEDDYRGLSAERSRYPNRSPDFSSMLPIPTPSVTVTRPTFLVVEKI